MKLTDGQIKHMVDRFLGWQLPANFSPDGGVSATRPNYAANVEWTLSGTNLFDATQADAMVRYMADGMPEAHEDILAELRQRNSDLSYMAGERDILLAAIERISSIPWIADRAKDEIKALRAKKQ